MPLNVEEECGKDVREIEELAICEGNVADAGKFDPSLNAGIAPHRDEGGYWSENFSDPRTARAGESIGQMVAERRQNKGDHSYPERLRGR